MLGLSACTGIINKKYDTGSVRVRKDVQIKLAPFGPR